MDALKKVLALLTLIAILCTLAACGEPENGETADTTATADATTTASATRMTVAPPEIPAIDGEDPLSEKIFRVDTATLPFSTETVDPLDPNFEVGKYYTAPTVAFRQSDDDKASFGLWIWDARVIVGKSPTSDLDGNTLLDMMIQNRITDVYLEIGRVLDMESLVYYSDINEAPPQDMITEMQLRGFVKRCAQYGIRVEALVGDTDSSAGRYFGFDGKTTYSRLKTDVAHIASYNERAAEDERICGIQFDVEPNWNGFDGRKSNIQYMANFFTYARKLFDCYHLEMDFCITSWTKSSDMVADESGYMVNLLDVLTKKCDSLTVMSYRQSAKDQYNLGELELEYGKRNGCRVVLGSETMPPEKLSANERKITYYELGAAKMSEEQTLLRQMIEEKTAYDNVGGAIHHAETFYDMVRKNP